MSTSASMCPGDDPVAAGCFRARAEYPLHQNSVGYLWRKARDAG